ncbi:MAG: DUF2007 domain-containing protein [Candidatus Fermentibacteria bacterium]|nr:DUF2007 domain-containing protein [Candidatus Fermentibacteria bacterium]
MSEIEVVKVFNKRYEAEMAGELLREQGIESMISADDCGGQLMGLTSLRKVGVKLMVSKEDLTKAKEVLLVLDPD